MFNAIHFFSYLVYSNIRYFENENIFQLEKKSVRVFVLVGSFSV